MTKPKKRTKAAVPGESVGLPWESAPDGMYRLRGADGKIEFLSGAFGLLTGWSPSEWVGRSFAELVHPEDLPQAVQRYEATRRGERLPPFELRVRTKTGEFLVGEVHSAPLVEHGRVVGEVGIVRDITDRRAAEQALSESEERFRLLSEAALEGVAVTEQGTVVDCNEDLTGMLGYTREEMIGRPVLDFVAAEDAALVAERQRSESTARYEHAMRRKDGSTFYVEVQGRSIRYQGRKLRLTAIRDITERRRSELIQGATFRISEAAHMALSLQELFAELHRIVGELMPARNFYVALCEADRTMLSFPYFRDEVDQAPAPKPMGKGLTEYVLRTGQPLLATPEVYLDLERSGEVELIGAPSVDWLGVPLVAAGQPTGVLVVQTYTEGVRYSERDRDLLQFVSAQIAMAVERKRAEEALRESEEQYRRLVEHIHDALIRDDTDGNITFANDQFLTLFGYERAQLPHLKIDDYVPAEWREQLRERHARRMRGEAVPTTYEFEGVRRDGKQLWLEVDVVPLTDGTGRFIGTQSAIRDISERKALEAQLRQAQRMEAVGALAGGVAHDFNNLLTAVQASSSLLEAGLAVDSPLRDDVETIAGAARRGAELTRKLLAFSRRQALNLRPVSVREAATNFARLARRVVREDIEIVLQLVPEGDTIRADPGALDQILMNLVTNARDAMPTGGRILIAVGRGALDEEHRRTYGWGTPGAYVTLAVSDTGSGMDAETRQRIFEPFFTTKPMEQGSGMGMAIVYGLVKQHEGFVNVYSEVGQGTTVRLYFPAVTTAGSEPVRVAAPEVRGGTETILLVEDDEAVRRSATRVLTKFGYRVLLAADGMQALEMLRTNEHSPDLIVSDVIMPHLTGPQLLSKLREAGPVPKVLFTSGYTGRETLEHAELKPGVPMLAKPWTVPELLRMVREVLDGPAIP